MRKLALVIALLLMPLTVYAVVIVVQGRSTAGGGGGGGGDSCTGGLLFSWHMENNDDVTQGTPSGCSAGDSVATLNSGATYTTNGTFDGTYALHLLNSGSSATFTISTDDIVSDNEGTIDLYFTYTGAFPSGGQLIQGHGSGANYINILLLTNTDNELRFRHRGDNNDVTILTTGCNFVADTRYHIVAKWRQGVTDPSMSLTCDLTEQTDNTDLTNFAISAATLYIGDSGGLSSAGIIIDTVKIYSTWQ